VDSSTGAPGENFGGGEHIFVDLCRGLAAGGHEVSLRAENDWRAKLSFAERNFVNLCLRNSFDRLARKIGEIRQ